MEQPGLEPGPIWDAGTAGKGLAIVPVPSRSAFKILNLHTFYPNCMNYRMDAFSFDVSPTLMPCALALSNPLFKSMF